MKPVSLIGTGVLFLLLGSVVPTYAQDQHEQDAKPAKQDEKAKPEKKQEAKPAKQEEQAKPEKANRKPRLQSRNTKLSLRSKRKPRLRSRNTKLSLRSKRKPRPRSRNTKLSLRRSKRKPRLRSRSSSIKPRARKSNQPEVSSTRNHKGTGPTMVRKIIAATCTVKAGLDASIMPALKRMAVASTMGVGIFLRWILVLCGEPIRLGFTGKRCTSSWERTGYGMQLHTTTLP